LLKNQNDFCCLMNLFNAPSLEIFSKLSLSLAIIASFNNEGYLLVEKGFLYLSLLNNETFKYETIIDLFSQIESQEALTNILLLINEMIVNASDEKVLKLILDLKQSKLIEICEVNLIPLKRKEKSKNISI
jgi:hypothetical protein